MRDEDQPLYAALDARLRAAGLARVAGELLALAQPAITLALTRVDEGAIAVGASKVGGTADLPPGVAWPEWRSVPLPFIAQVRLEEVAALDPEGDLPHQGLLSCFYAVNDPDGGLHIPDGEAHWRALYAPDTTALERRPLPAPLVGGLDTTFPGCAVTLRRRLTLPPDPNAVAAALGCSNDERLALIGIVGGDLDTSFADEMDHRLLGYPYTLNDPHPFLEGYLARHGIGQRLPMPDSQTRMAELERAADAEWRMLLQIYSNEEAEMDWGGGGVIHFGIPRADLAARDFSRVWVNLDFL
jgi:hypothetical protein